MDILHTFCDIDDFCLFFEPLWNKRLLADVARQRQRAGRLALSEVMTIIVLFHSSGYRNFRGLLHRTRFAAHDLGFPAACFLQSLR